MNRGGVSMDKDYEDFVARMGSFDMDIDLGSIQNGNRDDELTHYGVLGMKWGIRRYQPYPKGQSGKGVYKGKTKPPKVKKTHLSKKKQAEADMKSMTDQELRQRINRLQMEKQYTQLSVGERNVGQKAASMVLNKIGNKVIDRVIDRTLIDPIDAYFKGRK